MQGRPATWDLTIIVVNWNTRDLLCRCLDSIQAWGSLERHRAVETIVVDNDSSDDSVAVVRERYPWVRLIASKENVGFARANNRAIRESAGRYVLLLNSDAELVPGALSAMLEHMAANPRTGITSVRLAFPDGTPQFCYGSFPSLITEFRSLFGLHRWDLSCWDDLSGPKKVDWVSGACLMARRKTLDEIGLLDESFFMFGEEVDLCYRAVEAGWDVTLVPSRPVVHARGGSTGKTPGRILRLYDGKLRYARKHFDPAQRFLLGLMISGSTVAKLAAYAGLSLIDPAARESLDLWQQVSGKLFARQARRGSGA